MWAEVATRKYRSNIVRESRRSQHGILPLVTVSTSCVTSTASMTMTSGLFHQRLSRIWENQARLEEGNTFNSTWAKKVHRNTMRSLCSTPIGLFCCQVQV